MASASSMAELEKEIATKVGEEREEEEEKSIYVNVLAPGSSNRARDVENHWYVIRSSGGTSEMSPIFKKKPPCNPDTGLTLSNCVLVASSTLYLIGGLEPCTDNYSNVVRYMDIKSSDDSAGWKIFRSLPFPCCKALTAASSAASGPWIYVILGERDAWCEQREPWGYVFHAEKKYKAYPLNPPPDAPSDDDPYAIVGYKDGVLVHMPKDNRLYFHDSLTHKWSLYYDGDVAYRGYEYPDAYVLSNDVLYFYDAGDVPRLSAFDLVQRKRFPPVDLPSALCFAYDANVNLVAVAKDKLCMLRRFCPPCVNGINVYYTKFSVSRDDSSLHVVVEEDQSFLTEAYCIVNCVAL